MANFNRINFVEESVASYLEFMGEKELIVVDCLSTDGSLEFLSSYADVIISEKDSSVYEAWNKALTRATGHWIFFLNTDDCLLPDFNEIYAQLPIYQEFDMLRFEIEIQDQNNLAEVSLKSPMYSYSEIISSPIYFNGYIFAASVFKIVGTFNENFRYCADQDFLWRCKEQGLTSKILKNVGYRYTRHLNSLTISNSTLFFEEEKLIAELRLFFAKNRRSKKMAEKWVEWETLSTKHLENKFLRIFSRLLNTKTYLIQLFQIFVKIESPVARLFN